MTLEYKMISPVLKSLDDKGTGQAVIATLNAVDHDMDVTSHGAFGEQWVKMVPAHEWKHPAIGKARLREVGNLVVADFRMYLKMHSAMEWYQSLKADMESPPHLQEWSYGFRVIDSSRGEHDGKQVRFIKQVKAIEISPVMIGAGVGTHTFALKAMHDLKETPGMDEPAGPVTIEDGIEPVVKTDAPAPEGLSLEAALTLIEGHIEHLLFTQELRQKKGRSLAEATIARIDQASKRFDALRRAVALDPAEDTEAGVAWGARQQDLTRSLEAHDEEVLRTFDDTAKALYDQHLARVSSIDALLATE